MMLLFLGSSLAFANNSQDREWEANLPRFQGNFYTEPATKTDRSYAYIKLKEIGKGRIRAWLQKSNGVEVNSPKYTVKQGQEKFVRNDAYEQYGRTDVRMAIESDDSRWVRIHAAGVWSPDSVDNYGNPYI